MSAWPWVVSPSTRHSQMPALDVTVSNLQRVDANASAAAMDPQSSALTT